MKTRVTAVLIVAATVISYGRLLTFTFWKDDWFLLWSALSHGGGFGKYWVHPATVIEFLWAAGIFQANPLPWMLTGVLMHIGIAYAVALFVHEAIEDTRIALLAGMLYAPTAAGVDAVGWPSAHVAIISGVGILISFLYLFRYLKRGKTVHLALFFLYTGIALFCDPIRNSILFVVIPFLWLCLGPGGERAVRLRRAIRLAYIPTGALALVIFFLFRAEVSGSPLISRLLEHGSVSYAASRIYLIGNYANSLVNLMLGWLVPFPEDASTGIYSPIWARLGAAGIFAGSVAVARAFIRKRDSAYGMILFGIAWTVLFYLPNWLFEPRLTMGITHRYFVVSGIGFVFIIAGILKALQKNVYVVPLALLCIAANIRTVWRYSADAAAYRNADVVEGIWNAIDRQFPENVRQPVFVYEGTGRLKTYALDLSGGYPIAVKRHIMSASRVPVVLQDPDVLAGLLCKKGVPINHVFAWKIEEGARLQDSTLPTRRHALEQALENGCVPVIDQEVLRGNK